MSDFPPVDDLLADLKKDTHNVARSHASEATKTHTQGAMGKLATAIAQHEGAENLQSASNNKIAQIPMTDGPVDKQAIQERLDAQAEAILPSSGEPIPRGSEASRLQSAADQYRLAQEGK
ncbi:hypothetical protein A1O1_05551 [Capronia coronata CBS 617.96]|uniref:Uncharacterized protein n=1 Tax=Capronia coronata CBS 617.96 TaxID=1182541 RepID=W9YH77_9EURO|nr:uncharacterized protein A1O1_05551 [Capronia coronata CBS 617.96]EXJ88621.1 hypothetical protein A1O1_05551 [Capronia coronata CBS 617.96]